MSSALDVLAAKAAAACKTKRLPAAKDITRPPGAKQANFTPPAGNPIGVPTHEVVQTMRGHDPNPPATSILAAKAAAWLPSMDPSVRAMNTPPAPAPAPTELMHLPTPGAIPMFASQLGRDVSTMATRIPQAARRTHDVASYLAGFRPWRDVR